MKNNKPDARSSPEATAKRMATLRAKKLANGGTTSTTAVAATALDERVKDAMGYLRGSLRAQDRDLSDTLVRMAVHALRGTL